jgi:hypothetical protein
LAVAFAGFSNGSDRPDFQQMNKIIAQVAFPFCSVPVAPLPMVPFREENEERYALVLIARSSNLKSS